MKVRHLNCGTFRPLGGSLVNGKPGKLVCHCLLVETEAGLVLIDSGLGLHDIKQASKRLGKPFFLARPLLDEAESAVRQIEGLGYKVEDVRHIILTHLDLDHASGIADFPQAKVHVFGPEYIAAMAPATFIERLRYKPIQWSHGPDWTLHTVQGEKWLGFECVREMPGLPQGILMVPLTGHTLGHCGVAVKTERGWLLHAGDSYFFREEMNVKRPHCTLALSVFQKLIQVDEETRLHNQTHLREALVNNPDELRVFCAHDPVEFAALKNG